MNKTNKIALSGLIAALSVVVMLFSFLPSVDLAIPAIAGIFLILIVIEVNKKTAVAVFFVVSILALILCYNKESVFFYIAFFGLYPIIKAIIESFKNKKIIWVAKFVYFNIVLILIYLIISFFFNLDLSEFEILGNYVLPVLAVVLNVMFVIYDILISRIIGIYLTRYQSKLKRVIGKK